MVEVIFDRVFSAAGDEKDFLATRPRQFFDDVLHDRLLADRQHFLRLRFRGWQQPRADPGYGDNSILDQSVKLLG